MKYKVEFEMHDSVKDLPEEQIMEFLNFELGITNSMETKNPLSHACINTALKNVKITKQI